MRAIIISAVVCVLSACGGTLPDRDLDGTADSLDCAPDDASIHPGADDTCDGIDTDCNGVVDDGAFVEHGLTHRDVDQDGFGSLDNGPDEHGCTRPGWVLASESPVLDCNDANAAVTPETPLDCDFDHDSVTGRTDCDDHNPVVKPGNWEICNGFDDDCDGFIDAADTSPPFRLDDTYVLDEDGDSYPSSVVIACTPPGGGYVKTTVVRALDCAPLDPNIHPDQEDDCASMTDRNCDGAFGPVHVVAPAMSAEQRVAMEASFTAAAANAPPTPIEISGNTSGVTVSLCPGSYRVSLTFGGLSVSPTYVVRGRGESPSDVVLDGGGVARVVDLVPWWNLDQGGSSKLHLENLTVAHGYAAETGGGVRTRGSVENTYGVPGLVELDHVAFQDCTATRGGALFVDSRTDFAATSATFSNTSASVSGGAIAFEGQSFAMTGGSFVGAAAPAGTAIAAVLTGNATFSLTNVDLAAIANDLAITTGFGVVNRDLGAAASVSCTTSGCVP